MKFPALARLGEIRSELAPLLEELGFFAALGRPNETARDKLSLLREPPELKHPVICFKKKDGSGFSTFEIQLGVKPDTDPAVLGWESAETAQFIWGITDAGDNGWAHFSVEDSLIRKDLPCSKDEVMAAIAYGLRDADVVWPCNPDRTTQNYAFADSYDYLRHALDPDDIKSIKCVRENNIESYNFLDPRDREWKVAFEGDHAVLYIDNVKEAAKELQDARSAAFLVTSHMIDIGLDYC